MDVSTIVKKIIWKLLGFERMPKTGENPFNWNHLPDKRLYTDNDYAVNSISEGIELDIDINYAHPEDKSSIYHSYWYGAIGKKQAFSIKSFLCTQNLDKCKLYLWLDISNGYEGYENNPFLRPLLPYITVKAFDPASEVADTPWENHIKLINHHGKSLAKRADAFRFIVLYSYGGVYFDLDVMFLKDFGNLLNYEFCYAWEQRPFANSAILNLKSKSNIASYILEKSIKKRTVLPWIILNYSDKLLKSIYVLPCALFDPLWQSCGFRNPAITSFEQFFQPFYQQFVNEHNIKSYKDFFPGCYTYHWHNQWKATEHENSFFGIFDKEFDKLLNLS